MTSGRGRSLRVDIAGDAEKLKRELASAQRAVKEAERDLARMGVETADVTRKTDAFGASLTRQERIIADVRRGWAAYAAAIGVATAVGGTALYQAGQAIESARQEEQARARVTAIFEEQSGAIEEWAQHSANSIGLSRRASLEAAGDFGNMFDQLGIGREQIVGMSTDIVNLAADYGAFHDADISDVIVAQSAAFRGEYDALQRYLPTINAAHVQQKALAMGLADTTAELTTQDKALATYEIMMTESGKAVGAFARESDELTGSQARLDASIENLQSRIGDWLVPAAADGTEALNKLLDSELLEQGISNLEAIVSAMQTLAGLGVVTVGVNVVVSTTAATAASALDPRDGITGWLGDRVQDAGGILNAFRRGDDLFEAIFQRAGGGLPSSVIAEARSGRGGGGGAATPEAAARGPRITYLGGWNEDDALGAERSAINTLSAGFTGSRRAGGGSSRSGGGGGGADVREALDKAAAESTREFFAAMSTITRDNLEELARAHFAGGAEQVAIVKEQQAEMLREVTKKANELRQVLGIDLADAMVLAKSSIEAVAEAEEALAKQREEEARRQRMDAFGVTSTLIDMGVGVEEAIRLGNESVGLEAPQIPVTVGMRPYDGGYTQTGPNSGQYGGFVNYGEVNVQTDHVDAESLLRLQDRAVG
ncbi:MAG: hypothetical protein M0R75_16330 [Dehalococcoidia bacterium]|nr:hypothetical protein [Dehalococcoidia bacterium]